LYSRSTIPAIARAVISIRKTHTVKTPKGFEEPTNSSSMPDGRRYPAIRNSAARVLPIVMNNSLYEMMNSANQAWTMYPGLSHGAYECLRAHGTPEQKAMYLPKLVSGRMDRHHVF